MREAPERIASRGALQLPQLQRIAEIVLVALPEWYGIGWWHLLDRMEQRPQVGGETGLSSFRAVLPGTRVWPKHRGPTYMTREQRVRAYGAHLALVTVKRDGVFTLSERYGGKRKIGTYRSVEALEGAITRHGERMLETLKQ